MNIITAAYMSVAAFLSQHKGNDEGATAVEYGLMVALIAAVIAGIVFTLGGHLNDIFGTVNNCVQTAANCDK